MKTMNTTLAATMTIASLRAINRHRAANATRHGSIIITIDGKIKAVVGKENITFSTIDPSMLPAAILAAKKIEWEKA